MSDVLKRIIALAFYYAKPHHPSVARHPAGDKRVTVLTQIDGVGTTIAKDLLAHYGCLENIMMSDDVTEVAGIGPKIRDRLEVFWRS